MRNHWGKNLICMLMAIVFFIPYGLVHGQTNQLEDIQGHWAEADIREWVEQGIVSGYPDQTFRPDKVVTRGEFVALVNRAFKYSEKGSIGFKDVKKTDWVHLEVQKAIKQGYINGFSDNTFRSNQQITRQETAVILSKILKLSQAVSASTIPFKDSNLIPDWSISSISQIVHSGIMDQYADGTFQPTRQMTRAEMVVSIKKALAAVMITYDKPGVYGEAAKKAVATNVTIQSRDVTLRNMHIFGDLVISKEVGEGNVYLDQVQVDGTTRVEGGGMESVHLINSKMGKLLVNRLENPVRIVAEGTTVIGDTQVLSSASLEEATGLTGEGFGDVTVLSNIQKLKQRDLILSGNFNKVNLMTDLKEIKVRSGAIKILAIQGKLTIASIVLDKGVKVDELDLQSKTTVSGEGQIGSVTLSKEAEDSVLPKSNSTTSIPFGGFPGGGFPGGGIPGGGSPEGSTPGGGGSSGGTSATVKGTLFYWGYDKPNKIPIYNQTIFLNNVNETSKSYTGVTNHSGAFSISNIDPGTYTANVYLGLTRYYSDEFTVKAGQTLTLPDLVIKEEAPQPSVEGPIYTDIGYTSGRVFYLKENYSVKVELSDGTVLHTPDSKFNTFFSFNLFDYNPDLILHGNDVLYVTLYADSGWTSGRIAVLVVERPQTKSPVVTKNVYDDTRTIRVQVTDWSNEIKITKLDGTVIGSNHNALGNTVEIYLPKSGQLDVGEKIKVYAQANGKRISEPTYVTVLAPVVQTLPPSVAEVVYDDDNYIAGTAEGEAIIVVKRSNGTVIGEGAANSEYGGGRFNLKLTSPLVVGEVLSITAKGYEKIVSGSTQVTVALRPTTATPTVVGDIYADYTSIQVDYPLPNILLYLKDMNGNVISQPYSSAGGTTYIHNLNLDPETQYQLTAKASGLKESQPFLFTTIVPTEPTPVPSVTAPVYADANYVLPGVTEPYAKVYFYYGDGTLIHSIRANDKGDFSFVMPSFPPLAPGETLLLRADAEGKVMSEALVLTTVMPVEKTSPPVVTDLVYGYTSGLEGKAARSALVSAYREDGTQISTGIYADKNSGNWKIGLVFTVLRGGDRIYVIADEAGKLPSDPVYITIQSAPKSNLPSISGNVSAETKNINGTYNGPRLVDQILTIIMLVNDNGNAIETSLVGTDGSFSINVSSIHLVAGQKLKIVAKEAKKEASDPLVITVN
ncbi:S-layer homology domain-containing protein [Cohnella abietis]|uniref:SLH domain-containing protein n=1 Tax=Cohnella abietis TaxID=2507935 RepID=A0A3T1CZG3_9BACL|nr:S-layer homology domain-containing protein [Cohnella abietis]BBI31159.1 hypothetical protein KCTCHS21_05580 [Cohnella abietis]